MKPISVNDRLPEVRPSTTGRDQESDWVLAFVSCPTQMLWCILRYVQYKNCGFWIEDLDEPLRLSQVNGVSHWMPLPPAPETK